MTDFSGKVEGPEKGKDLREIGWNEFRNSGMLWFTNTILHAFGMVLVFDVEESTGEVKRVFPARTTFRGYLEKSNTAGYKKIAKYMIDNGEDILEESNR